MTDPTPQPANGSSLRYEHTDDRICWRHSADTSWVYDGDKKCKRQHNINERITEAVNGPAPVMPHMTLEFPDLDIRWPVPLEVGKGIENMIRQAFNNGAIQAIQGSFIRTAAIHKPVTADGESQYCQECGRKAGYPCATLNAVLGEAGKDAQDDHAPEGGDAGS